MLLLPNEVRDALIKYLAARPWQEVQEVMPVLINLPAAPTGQLMEGACQS